MRLKTELDLSITNEKLKDAPRIKLTEPSPRNNKNENTIMKYRMIITKKLRIQRSKKEGKGKEDQKGGTLKC